MPVTPAFRDALTYAVNEYVFVKTPLSDYQNYNVQLMRETIRAPHQNDRELRDAVKSACKEISGYWMTILTGSKLVTDIEIILGTFKYSVEHLYEVIIVEQEKELQSVQSQCDTTQRALEALHQQRLPARIVELEMKNENLHVQLDEAQTSNACLLEQLDKANCLNEKIQQALDRSNEREKEFTESLSRFNSRLDAYEEKERKWEAEKKQCGKHAAEAPVLAEDVLTLKEEVSEAESAVKASVVSSSP